MSHTVKHEQTPYHKAAVARRRSNAAGFQDPRPRRKRTRRDQRVTAIREGAMA